MSAPVRRIDEILALPYSVDEFKDQEVPPSDADYWLYNGEEELNSALNERQKEMELFDLKHKNKGKGKKGQNNGSNTAEFNPGDVAKLMRAFVDKVSSFEGAEAPEDRSVSLHTCSFKYYIFDMHASKFQRLSYRNIFCERI